MDLPLAISAAEKCAVVLQMLEAKASRRERRGEAPIDVEAETTRLLEPLGVDPEAEQQLTDLLRSR